MRILGIDVGESRTGVAISDPVGVTCSPLPVIRERDRDKLLLRIDAIAAEYGADVIVVGVPRPLRGGTNAQLDSVLDFKDRLARVTTATVMTWDERFTSKLAGSSSRDDAEQDSVAACYMLQNYLDRQSKT